MEKLSCIRLAACRYCLGRKLSLNHCRMPQRQFKYLCSTSNSVSVNFLRACTAIHIQWELLLMKQLHNVILKMKRQANDLCSVWWFNSPVLVCVGDDGEVICWNWEKLCWRKFYLVSGVNFARRWCYVFVTDSLSQGYETGANGRLFEGRILSCVLFVKRLNTSLKLHPKPAENT